MKHLVITPFFYEYKNPPYPNEDALFGKSVPILDTAIGQLNSFLVPSLENQTNKNFIWVIGHWPMMKAKRPDIYKKLVEIRDKTSFPVQLCPWNRVTEFADGLHDDYIVTTRVDHDDCFSRDVVKIIQEKYLHPENDFTFFAFMSGAVMWTDRMYELREFVSTKWRDGLSSFSITPTFMVNWKKHKIINRYGHARITDFLNPEKNGIVLVPGVNHFYDYDTKLAWLYVRHHQNRSREITYRFGDKIDISRDQIKYQFGM